MSMSLERWWEDGSSDVRDWMIQRGPGGPSVGPDTQQLETPATLCIMPEISGMCASPHPRRPRACGCTGHIISRALCKLRMQGPMFRKY